MTSEGTGADAGAATRAGGEADGASAPRSASSALGWAGLLVVAAVALAARLLGWHRVFTSHGVEFYGNDAYYHARRVLYGVEHFPRVLERDAFLNFPAGGEAIWSPAFDWTATALVLLLGADSEAEAVKRVLVWIPPLLGAAAVLLVMALARRRWGFGPAAAAGATLAVLPAHVSYSQLGFFDHHVAVAFAWAALLGIAMPLCERRAGSRNRDLARAAALGVIWAGAVLLWPGMLLHVALLDLALLATALATDDAKRATRLAALAAVAHGVAAGLLWPLCGGRAWAVWGDFSPVVLTSFHPWFAAAQGLYFAALAALCHWCAGDFGRRRRLGLAALAGGGLVLAGLLVAGSLAAALGDVWGWFAREEAFQAEVRESRPLLAGPRGLARALGDLSGWLLVAPLLLGWNHLRRSASVRPGDQLLLLTTAGLLLAALIQSRFANSAAVGLALGVGLALAGWRPRAGASRVALLTALCLIPSLAAGERGWRNGWALLRGQAPLETGWEQRKDLLLDVARWLRDNTPAAAPFTAVDPDPDYGVLSHWADGHVLLGVGRRPTVVGNFGDDVGTANWRFSHDYYLASEAEASAILERLRARYVVFEYRPARSRWSFGPASVLSRLYFDDGQVVERSIAAREGEFRRVRAQVPAVERHRLVYESAPKPYAPSERAGFKVYEHVRGARIVGEAAPGARVSATLTLATERGRRFDFASATRADESGRFSLRVPYATVSRSGFVRAASDYRLQWRGQRASVAVSERDVAEGREVAVP
ncbi:MAG: hypothetical protein MJE66_13415 [Proteobacteria bacterium]|nr:hypothetical protein [Pseudomonadota bacterium]